MTKQERIEKAVKIITDDFKQEIADDAYYSNIENYSEMVKVFGWDSTDLKEEVKYILLHSEASDYVNDEKTLTLAGDSWDDDVAYKDYMKLVRKEMNRWFKEKNGEEYGRI